MELPVFWGDYQAKQPQITRAIFCSCEYTINTFNALMYALSPPAESCFTLSGFVSRPPLPTQRQDVALIHYWVSKQLALGNEQWSLSLGRPFLVVDPEGTRDFPTRLSRPQNIQIASSSDEFTVDVAVQPFPFEWRKESWQTFVPFVFVGWHKRPTLDACTNTKQLLETTIINHPRN